MAEWPDLRVASGFQSAESSQSVGLETDGYARKPHALPHQDDLLRDNVSA